MKLIFEVIASVIFSVRSAGVIIFALSNYLGKIWASKILEKDKARYNCEIEELKSKFNKELECYRSQLELSRQTISKYSEHQLLTLA